MQRESVDECSTLSDSKVNILHAMPMKARRGAEVYCMGLRGGLDGHGKSRPHRYSIPGPSIHNKSL